MVRRSSEITDPISDHPEQQSYIADVPKGMPYGNEEASETPRSHAVEVHQRCSQGKRLVLVLGWLAGKSKDESPVQTCRGQKLRTSIPEMQERRSQNAAAHASHGL